MTIESGGVHIEPSVELYAQAVVKRFVLEVDLHFGLGYSFYEGHQYIEIVRERAFFPAVAGFCQ